jgi:hypothetical protein
MWECYYLRDTLNYIFTHNAMAVGGMYTFS